MSEYRDENTLFKVRDALIESGVLEEDVIDIINQIQNKGILFRERGDNGESSNMGQG